LTEQPAPLDSNETDGLIPKYVATHADLDEAEQRNILKARAWASGRKHKGLLSEGFVRTLHRRMFDDVWLWAGRYRQSDITDEVKRLTDDAAYWVALLIYPWDELGARFHHRLVALHPFPNGNGRHARLMTDLLLEANDQRPFTWGATLDNARGEYMGALVAADGGDFGPLIGFVRK
jgi:Fic-DOC domain mobile mystery protein B